MQTVLDKAVEAYRRKLFLEEVNRAYAELREDREAWGELESERAAWDSTLADGLPEREPWSEESESPQRRKQLKILDLFGQIDYDPDHDYKEQRRRE